MSLLVSRLSELGHVSNSPHRLLTACLGLVQADLCCALVPLMPISWCNSCHDQLNCCSSLCGLLQIIWEGGTFKEGLARLLKDTHVQCVFMGTRRNDPHGGGLEHLDLTTGMLSLCATLFPLCADVTVEKSCCGCPGRASLLVWRVRVCASSWKMKQFKLLHFFRQEVLTTLGVVATLTSTS